MSAKRVAITGATGFLGQHVVQAMKNAGHHVIAVVRDSVRARKLLPRNIEIRSADILDELALIAAFENVDVAIHLAGFVSVNKCDAKKLDLVNVRGAQNFLSAIKKVSVTRAIFTSTTSTVGALTEDRPTNALDETAFFNLEDENIDYINAKRKAHILALNAQDDDQPVIIISPSFMLGPKDVNLNGAGLIDAIRRRALPLCPHGGVNPIDVRDVAKIYVELIDHPSPSPHYIAASKQNITLKAFVGMVSTRAFVKPPLFSLPDYVIVAIAKLVESIMPDGELTADGAKLAKYYWYFDASLARQELSLNCRPLEETIISTLQWLREHESEEILKYELEQS